MRWVVICLGKRRVVSPHQCHRGDLPPRGRRNNAIVELECTKHPATFTRAIVLDRDVYLEQAHFVVADLVGVIGSFCVGDPLRRAIEVWHLILGCHCKKQLECDCTLGKYGLGRVRMIWVRPYASNRVAASVIIKTNGEIAGGCLTVSLLVGAGVMCVPG